MDWHRKTIRLGGTVIACALLLRLLATVPGALLTPKAMSVLLFLETGRVVQQMQETGPADPTPTPTEAPEVETTPLPAAVAAFSAADAQLVRVNNVCGYEADITGGLTQTLSWELRSSEPTVLIVHSHGSESYENTEGYSPSSEYRTRDTDYNMVSVGERLVEVLAAGGIHAIHDRQMHDVPSYSASYANSRESIQAYLDQYPSIRLVLDLHRDAVEDSGGKQLKFTAEREGQTLAQLMLVVGTDAGGLSHPNWPDNMSLAVKLHAQLEKMAPGSCRPISFRSQRFNQDLSPGALIVEVGSAGNTRQEALGAAELLGEAILAMAQGTAVAES